MDKKPKTKGEVRNKTDVKNIERKKYEHLSEVSQKTVIYHPGRGGACDLCQFPGCADARERRIAL